MSKILIVSATSNNNLKLATSLQNILVDLGSETDIVNLQNVSLPLYSPEAQEEGLPENAKVLAEAFKEASALVICAPEYNGNMPPILVNAVAWISVSGDKDWRKAFNQKFIVIASHSAGGGVKLATSLQLMLQHLGGIVMPRQILTSYDKPMNEKSAKAIMTQLVSLTSKAHA